MAPRAAGAAEAVAAPGPPVDPVRELLVLHRELCEHAVDPLEIAVALEDAGVDSAAAARYRHADVFGLAEELYARVPRRPSDRPPTPRADPWAQRLGAALRGALLHLLPVLVLVAARRWLPAAELPALMGAAGWLAWAAPTRRAVAAVAYGVGVALLLAPAWAPGRPVPAALALASALALGSAEWSARWLGRAGRAQLTTATTLADFRSRMRPALPVAAALHLAAVALLSFAALVLVTRPGPGGLLHAASHRASGAEWAGQAAVGLLLLLITVLLHCARPGPAVTALLTAAAAEGVIRLLDPAAGAAAQLAPCGPVAVLLLPYAWSVLVRPQVFRARDGGG